MVLNIGVDLGRLEYWMFNALNVIKNVVTACGGEDAMVTPAYGGDDGSQSDIYNILLVDMGRKGDTVLAHYRIKRALGEKYDVKIEKGLIRVKYIFG